jgi:hypothetical protein
MKHKGDGPMIHKLGTSDPMTTQAMTNERLREFVELAEKREMARLGKKLPDARQALADRWKLAAGTLENLRRLRIKKPALDIKRAIRAGLLADLKAEESRIQHERFLLLQCDFDLDSSEVNEMENALEKVRAAYQALDRRGAE